MKKIALLSIALLLVCSVGAQTKMTRLTKFEGKPITSLDVSGAFNVEVISSGQTKATVEIPAEYESGLIFELDPNGTLRVGFDRTNFRKGINGSFRLTVNTATLNGINISGAVNMTCQGNFSTQNAGIKLTGASRLAGLTLDSRGNIDMECSGASLITNASLTAGRDVRLEVSGAAKADADVKSSDLSAKCSGSSNGKIAFTGNICRLEASGASKLTTSGTAREGTLNVSGASKIEAEQLVVDIARIRASAASQATIHVKNELNAEASAASSIRFRGNPKIKNLNTSAASSINQM